MTDPERLVSVDLGGRSYGIHIAPGLTARAGQLIAPFLARPKTAIVTDETVAGLHLPALQASLSDAGIAADVITVPAGEASKSYRHFEAVCDGLLAAGIERNDPILAFGGGVVGDLAGYAAASVRRGVPFIQLPTTLLAQVDSSVGGKTGINSRHGKNLIGAFHQPRAVIADTDLLNTLPDRQLAAGYAEVAKYGLLGDADLFQWLDDHLDDLIAGRRSARERAIEASCNAKARVVASDETEKGQRALLNLGHTFGHALEAATGYSAKLLHGEGVSIGMVLAFRLSERLGLCPSGVADRVAAHLARAGLPVSPRHIGNDLPGASDMLALMRQDKKASAGKLVFILAHDIGKAFVARDIAEQDVLAFLNDELGKA